MDFGRPAFLMGEFQDDSSCSFSALLCYEDEDSIFNGNDEESDCFDENDYIHNMGCDCCVFLETEDAEYIETLIETEKISSVHASLLSADDDCSTRSYHQWLKRARLDAITWILNTRAVFGFQFRTAYLSVTYLDRFLSKRLVDEGKLWAIRLLCLACLSLAAKMEERQVPPLPEFLTEDYCFKSKAIKRMELMVLSTLDWKMMSVTPFAYLHYFINKIHDDSRSEETAHRALELILAIIKETNSLDYRPSIIALAAVLAAASNDKLTRKELELKMDRISSWGSTENESTFSCYIAMMEIGSVKLKTPGRVIFPSVYSSSIDDQRNSCFTTGAMKRRRIW